MLVKFLNSKIMTPIYGWWLGTPWMRKKINREISMLLWKSHKHCTPCIIAGRTTLEVWMKVGENVR